MHHGFRLCRQWRSWVLFQRNTALITEPRLNAEIIARLGGCWLLLCKILRQFMLAGNLPAGATNGRQALRPTLFSSPPAAALASTTSHGGSFQKINATRAIKASPKSDGPRMALVQTG